jgi:hypothetical protein
MFAAVACVRPRQSHVGNPSLVDVHRTYDQWTRREFDDERADGKIQKNRGVRCIRIRGEHELLGGTVECGENLVGDESDFASGVLASTSRWRPEVLRKAVMAGSV